MPIYYPDNITTNNPDLPLIKASDTTIEGWSHVQDIAARNALPEAMRLQGAVVVVADIPYIYTSTSITNVDWENTSNWKRLDEGGATTIEGLTDVTVTSPTDNQVLLWDNSGGVWVNETLAYSDVAGTPILGLAATTNLYSDLDSLPILGLVATTNLYSDLDSLPTLGLAAETNNYSDLSELPTFVASTGMTINTTVNANGGTEYTFISTGGAGGGDATIAGGIAQFADTDISTPGTGQVLVYDTNGGTWDNVSRSFANDITVSPLPASGGGALIFDGTSTLSFSPADLSPYLTTVSLGDLTDVDPAGATIGQILEYDGADWVAADAPTGGAGDALTSNGIDQFADVGYAGAPSAGQVLEFVGATWRNVAASKLSSLTVNTAVASGNGSLSFDGTNALTFTPAAVPTVPTVLGDLTDVDTGGATSGDILEYDGADWVVATPSGGSGPVTLSYDGHLDAAIAKDYYLTTYAPAAQTVTDIKAVCEAGSCTIEFFIFGSLLVHSQTVNSGTLSATAPTGINSIPAGAELKMVISNVVGCFDLRFTMVYTQ